MYKLYYGLQDDQWFYHENKHLILYYLNGVLVYKGSDAINMYCTPICYYETGTSLYATAVYYPDSDEFPEKLTSLIGHR